MLPTQFPVHVGGLVVRVGEVITTIFPEKRKDYNLELLLSKLALAPGEFIYI